MSRLEVPTIQVCSSLCQQQASHQCRCYCKLLQAGSGAQGCSVRRLGVCSLRVSSAWSDGCDARSVIPVALDQRWRRYHFNTPMRSRLRGNGHVLHYRDQVRKACVSVTVSAARIVRPRHAHAKYGKGNVVCVPRPFGASGGPSFLARWPSPTLSPTDPVPRAY